MHARRLPIKPILSKFGQGQFEKRRPSGGVLPLPVLEWLCSVLFFESVSGEVGSPSPFPPPLFSSFLRLFLLLPAQSKGEARVAEKAEWKG